jgi:hypothetical protein
MTTFPAAASDPTGVASVVCSHCHTAVPAGRFCGYCGAGRAGSADSRLALLRPRVFAVAPAERVLLPMVSSTLFPQLPQIYRNPFRIGMGVIVLGVVAFAVLRLIGPLVTLVALGVPVLFVLYHWQAGLWRDIPVRALAVSAGLGAALGVGWVWLTGNWVARAYGIPMAAGFVLEDLIGAGLIISVGGAILMVMPAVAVRILKPATRESLDGFVIGALGSLCFTAAATTTRLAPQFVAGLIRDVKPLRLFIEAVLYGIAAPLTAASVGGLIGIVLWFEPGRRAHEHPRAVRAALSVFTVLVVVIYTLIWVVDAWRLPKWPQLGLHILMTVIALLAARLCLQLALLHEEPDPFTGRPTLCLHCGHVVPDMPFCPACGAATRASSRSARRRTRASPTTRQAGTNSADV